MAETVKKPTHIIKAMVKGKSHRVGALWLNDSKEIGIRLDPFVVLEGRDNQIGGEYALKAYPNKPKAK